jgi:RHS repeat-associated protein
MNHLKSGTAFFGQASYKNHKYNSKELQETGMYSYGWRDYMPDIARWNGIDQLSEKFHAASPYAYVLNNPISFTDPDGRDIHREGENWSLNGSDAERAFSYMQGGGKLSYLENALSSWETGGGNFVGDNMSFWDNFGGIDAIVPEVTINARGNKNTWNIGNNLDFNQFLMMSLFTGAQMDWNLQQNRAFYYSEVTRTGADKIERNFYLMFGGALVAPFAGSYIATLGGETVASYLQGALIRGVTDMALQQTIKGSIDWKQTGINAFIGGGKGFGAIKVGWLNYTGNMVNNFGTSYYDGGKKGFMNDFGINSMKALTGIFGMGVGNYNGLTNGSLNGYFGTVLLPGVYFNTTDVVIENKIKK